MTVSSYSTGQKSSDFCVEFADKAFDDARQHETEEQWRWILSKV